jgi:four helix bundle protein
MGKGFRESKVWQMAKVLAVQVYAFTNSASLSRDSWLRDQMRRAAVSVASNIAGGDERDTNRDSVRFLYLAKGSLAEVMTQIIIAQEIGYLTQAECDDAISRCDTLGTMLGTLITARTPESGNQEPANPRPLADPP